MAKSKQDGDKKTSAGKTTQRRKNTATDSPKQVRGGIAQLVTPSPELGVIVGAEPLSRAELTKRVWAYIKSHNLQDATNRRQINADASLKQVLGKDQVSMFELTKLVNQHVR